MRDGVPDLSNEPELTRDEWETLRGTLDGGPIKVSQTVAPILSFDPHADANARRRLADQIYKFLQSPIGPKIDADAPLRVLLPRDLIGAWQQEIESRDRTTIATLDYAENPVFFTLTRSARDVNAVVDEDEIRSCNITPSHEMFRVVDSLMDPCRYFFWSTADGLVGWDVEMIWPLGNRPGDEADGSRVAVPPHVQEVFDQLTQEPRDQ